MQRVTSAVITPSHPDLNHDPDPDHDHGPGHDHAPDHDPVPDIDHDPDPCLTQTAETANSDLNDTAAGDTTTTLNKINDRKTLVADLKGCGTTRVTREDGRQFNVQIKIVKIR